MRVIAIGLVAVAGAVLGWDTAAATHSPEVESRAPAVATLIGEDPPVTARASASTLVVVPVPAARSEEARRGGELARLSARNRRLEALVKVLRIRELP